MTAMSDSWHYSSGLLGRFHEGRREDCPRCGSMRGKTVHHINGDLNDNRLENLMVVDPKENR